MQSAVLSCGQHSLPTELVLLVVEYLATDYSALATLAVTCRALQHLAEEQLYGTIELDTVRDLEAVIAAFTARRERARVVQSLKIQYQYRPEHLDGTVELRKTFNACIAQMVNLREWHIESPYDNYHWDKGSGGHEWVARDMETFREALEAACTHGPLEAARIQAERNLGITVDRSVGLAQLESLTIHSHGPHTDFWELQGFHCLFRHPNLRHLHVSCVDFPESIPALDGHVRLTPLTTLIFDECVLRPQSLLAILRTPVKLKHLTLGENVFNVRHSRRVEPTLSNSPTASLAALAAVAHSLETLVHHDPGWRLDTTSPRARRIHQSGQGLRDFHALRHIQCEMVSFLHQAIIMNHELCPPSLETLRLCRHWDVLVDFFDCPPDVEPYLALPSLNTLELVQSSYLWNELAACDYVCDEPRVRGRHAIGYKLYKGGINLKVMIEMHKSPSLIPPYLHGEATPVVQCVYDASEVGFRRHVETDGILSAAVKTESVEEITDPSDQCPGNDGSWLGSRTTNSKSVDIEQEAPETDQLGDDDITVMKGKTRRALEQLKNQFLRQRKARPLSIHSWNSWNSEEEHSLIDIDEDMEFDEDALYQDHDGNFYIGVYELETDEDNDDEEWEDTSEGMNVDNELD